MTKKWYRMSDDFLRQFLEAVFGVPMANNFDRILNAIADLKTQVGNFQQAIGAVTASQAVIVKDIDTLKQEVDQIKNDIEVGQPPVTGIDAEHGPPQPN